MLNKNSLLFLCLVLAASPVALAKYDLAKKTPAIVTISDDITIGFSPDGSAEALILQTINSAKKSIHMAAYSFTSPPVADALIKAKKRGLDVVVLVDFQQTLKRDTKGKGKAALNLLVNAKIPVRTVNTRSVQHNKYMVIDELHIQTGSYNYTAAGARYNSENVMLLKNNQLAANAYLKDWRKLYAAGETYEASY